MKFLSPIIWVLLAFGVAHADIIPIATQTQTFTNSNCAKTDSCDLKDFVVRQQDFKATMPSLDVTAFGSRMDALYDTSSLAALPKYGIVQFIQGCEFESSLANGKVVDSEDVSIEHYGKDVPFDFPGEVIDGFVPDPIDWGADPKSPSRHFYYYNKFIGSNEPTVDDFYGFKKPSIPRLYLRDIPGVAEVYSSGTAMNISLQFRDCIYKSADVPKVVGDTDLTFAQPIHCFSWNDSWVYDISTRKFEKPTGVANFCK